MPLTAADVKSSSYLRLLIMGDPKVGKTHCTLATCEKPAYVINCDDASALLPATKVTSDFSWDLVASPDMGIFQKMQNALHEAHKGVKEGRYKTIIVDTLSSYAQRIEPILADSTNNAQGIPDGRRYWPEYEKRLRNVIDRLFALPAHVIVLTHYLDVGGAVGDNQLSKTGPGLVPMFGGKARATIPALFQDVVFLEKRKGERVFVTSIEGVFGPGCRSLPGHSELPADIGEFWARANGKKVVK